METFTPLLTDFYQVTMGYAYWKCGYWDKKAAFTLTFRTMPFQGGYAIYAGLETALEFLERFSFSTADCAFLANLKSESGSPLFEEKFLDALREAHFRCDVESVPEGTPVFPHEPVLRIQGPIWQCQWVETALLNCINFQTLIATKAARVVEAAKGAPVLEFGLRRAQGFDGALSASRAAYVGGVAATSNLEAARHFGIPVRGTHAHSWIMAFESELEAFTRYATTFPDQCTLLVDTYDTRQGLRHAIEVGKALLKTGQHLRGIRLDSGDFTYLSEFARSELDKAGLTHTQIFASNELDEYLIQSLRNQGARIDAWGVGTKLVTAQDQPAMQGVYKLSAIEENGRWIPKIKVSDQPAKTSNPGLQRLRRYFDEKGFMEGDLIYGEGEDPHAIRRIQDPVLPHRHKAISPQWKSEELLVPVFQKGKRIYPPSSLEHIRAHRSTQMARLHPGIRRLENPHVYPVGLSPRLFELKTQLIEQAQERK